MIKDVEPLLKECEETLTDLLRLGKTEVACYVQGFINSINKLSEVKQPHGECRTCKHFVIGGVYGKAWVCEHPDIEKDDDYVYACINMEATDFCSRYEKGGGEAKSECGIEKE